MEGAMIPANQFNQITQALHDINAQPAQLKRMPEGHRKILLTALTNLENLYSERDVKDIVQILKSLGWGEVPQTSKLEKIQKAILNRFNRVGSAKLIKTLKKAEQDVWFNQGRALFETKKDDAKAFGTLEKAIEMGDHRAYALLGQLFEEQRVPQEALQKYLDRGVHNTHFWSIAQNRKKYNMDEHRELARDFYGKGAAKGDSVAQRKLAESNLADYQINKKPHFKAAAISWLKKSAKQGDAEAKLLLHTLGS